MSNSTVVEASGLVMNEHGSGRLEPMFIALARDWPNGTITEDAKQTGIGPSRMKTEVFLGEYDRAIQAAYDEGIAAGKKLGYIDGLEKAVDICRQYGYNSVKILINYIYSKKAELNDG